VLIVVWGCAGLPPASQREKVLLKTSHSIRYYSVRGMTAGAIFDDIDKNGLFDHEARRAVGLTSAEWKVDWKVIEPHPGLCRLESMTIAVVLGVTLPQHDRLNDLSENIRTKWQRFAARVAAHEQRHVDLYLGGAKRMKARMEAILTRRSSCSELESTVRGIWASQEAETEGTQNEFHREDAAKIREGQKPLQARIDTIQTRLAAIDSEMRRLDQTLDSLKRQSDRTHAELDGLKAEMARSRASLASCSQPRPTAGIQALCQRYSGLVAAYNALVGQSNDAVTRRNGLADEHNRVGAVINDLIEEINWTR
jgi:predicted secreted Zn-dependent protease